MSESSALFQISPYLPRLLFLSACLFTSLFSHSAEEKVKESDSINTATTQPSPSWPAVLDRIQQSELSDEVLNVNIKDTEIPVLNYWPKGKVNRGSILLLSTQGEPPTHFRLLYPLAHQLSHLGWQVLVPTLPNPDFPIVKDANKVKAVKDSKETANKVDSKPKSDAEVTKTDNNQNSAKEIPQKHYFNNEDEFQSYINQIITQAYSLITSQSGSKVIIGNQLSAYWLLNYTKTEQTFTQVVLISPDKPKLEDSTLNGLFEPQSLPVFTLITDEKQSKDYLNAFEQKKWNAPFIRINNRLALNRKLHIENNFLARTITGWVDSQLNAQ